MEAGTPEAWGWDARWAELWRSAGRHGGVRPARVVGEHRDRWAVTDGSVPVPAVLQGRIPRPAVGDWVAVRDGGPEGCVRIEDVLARRSGFSRGAASGESREQVVAANVDTVWICHGLDVEVNPARLDRYVAVGWEGGAQPAVVLTKSDLAEDVEGSRRSVEAVTPGVPVRVASATDAGGLVELTTDLLPGRTVALLGPSGAGKSTLANALLGRDELPTGAVRPGDRKGRHTTTRRQLVRLDGGALLLDTPGLRELRLWDVDDGLQRTFPDIHELAVGCRYRDCAHDSEPGCAVKEALAAGRMDARRLESFRKLRAEAAWQARRSDARARREESRRIRSIHKSLRAHPKYRDR